MQESKTWLVILVLVLLAGGSYFLYQQEGPPSTPPEQAVKPDMEQVEPKEPKAAAEVQTSSGLKYQVLAEGSGGSPQLSSQVTVHYRGTLENGKEFDNSYRRKEPATFPVNGVIPGWTEALLLMKVGDKWKLTIPPELGYGSSGAGGVIPPNATLIFEVELLEIH